LAQQSSSRPFLSIIIPVHNEEKRLPTTLEKLDEFIKAQSYAAEAVVVENGSRDRTLEIAQEFTTRMPNLTVLHEEQRGKGLAVRSGMLAARGEYRFFCDVDFSMPISEINRFIPPQAASVDVAIASREAPGAIRYNEPLYRHLSGRVFNSLVRTIVLPGLQDTQCGFKCFRAQVAEEVFPLQTLTGWAFDAEVLYIARRKGYQIMEIPISWYYNADSRVRIFTDTLSMTQGLLSIRRNARQGLYGSPNH
jgi:dolichyl-phosphate beta-glucosyltransferase